MTPPRTIDDARTAWLAGDGSAWAQYVACLRDLDGPEPAADRPARERSARRPHRRGRVPRA